MDNLQAAPMVDSLILSLSQAIKQKASDIHIEPFEKSKRTPSVDGVLQEDVQPPKGWKEQLVSRIKVMANLILPERIFKMVVYEQAWQDERSTSV